MSKDGHGSTGHTLLYSSDIESYVKSRQIKICVVGIGRIGLPTALSFARAGFVVTGLDINKALISQIRSGVFPLDDEPGYKDIFQDMIDAGRFSVTADAASTIPDSDIILLTLPTPMDDAGTPYYTALESVASQLNGLLTPGSIVVVESTVEPNFVESKMVKLIEGDRTRLRALENFGLGVCPETANPGEILQNFQSLPRLVGALDERTAKIISSVYSHVFGVELIMMPDCRTANAVKLTTNVFRDINVAFVNELAILFERLGIDVNVVLEAAKRKYNFEPHYPGAGVGGPCLPVNSYQLLHTASKLNGGNKMLNMIKSGRRVNESMPSHVVDMICDGLAESRVTPNASTIAILGLSYKPNVRDVQLAPSKKIIDMLKSRGARIRAYDPHYAGEDILDVHVEESVIHAVQGSSAAVLVTDHDELRELDMMEICKAGCKVFVDCKGRIDRDAVTSAGLLYRGVGRVGVRSTQNGDVSDDV